ncbi:adenosylcobinamide amidohydrolase [uncultured Methanobacterium sp.]|uniref:adenosylcobinamide amidohydrolase n=1 Tax=uncultured Methanobacterium sp. TaxID=176306 RepID=UPI002AA7A2F0|nr:adenosylcobinamide amidohydrolase [uncultured Methanobacterium sp.]
MKIQNDINGSFNNAIHPIHKTSTGEQVFRFKKSIVIQLPEKRNALTASWLNGGYREDIHSIFNHQLNQDELDHLEDGGVPDFMKNLARDLGTDPDRTAGFLTVADMDNVAIICEKFREIEVTSIVTAGIEVNGGRAGDDASYYELNGKYEFRVGTINTIIIINSHLSGSTLLRSVMTAVEAKTVALQELMAPSKYSEGIATGSGTDNIAVISNLESENKLSTAGKHSKLGELIGKSVIKATKEALSKQSNLNQDSQGDMLVRLERFGVNPEDYWKHVKNAYSQQDNATFMLNLYEFSKNPLVVSLVASILHIMDEIKWGLIPEPTGKKTAISIIKTLPSVLKMEKQPDYGELVDPNDSIIRNWIKVSSWCIVKSSPFYCK